MDRYLKCDLHMHSNSCYSRKYSKEDFINHMKNVDLDVFSITDHNVVDVKLYKELIKDLRDKNIIGGVELNLSIDEELVKKHKLFIKGEYFHAVLWFSTVDLDEFWEQLKVLISELKIDIKGKTIKEISKATEGKSFLLSRVQDVFKDFNYFLTFHEGKSSRCLSNYLPNSDTKSGIVYNDNQVFKHNLFYYNNRLAIEGGIKTKSISSYFEENLNTIVTRFFFSDALELEEIGKKFTWINFDGKFESLILPLSDPNARVFTSDINTENPQKNRENYLEKIKLYLINPKNNLEVEKIIEFSPSYNGIIGSRGSGKTLLGSALSNTNVSDYSKYINNAKTEFKIFGKGFQKSSPKCKYLAQNTLLTLFKNGEAKNIDFIKDFYGKLEKEKKELTKAFFIKAKTLLDYEKTEFISISTKYQSTINDITFLEDIVNEDYIIPIINIDSFQDGKSFITNLSQNIENIDKKVQELEEKLNQLKISSDEYTELIPLNSIVEDFKNSIKKHLKLIKDEISRTRKEITNFDNTPCILRDKLIKKYNNLVISTNNLTNKPGQAHLDDKDYALKQLQEYTKFRAKTQKVFDILSLGLIDVKSEAKSEEININNDKLTISSTIEDLKDYKEYLQEELKNYNDLKHSEKMFEILMSYNDKSKIKDFFSGQKYKANSLSSSNAYIEKFYSNLLSSIQKFDSFTIKLYFNGKDLEKYSPGKKSEILLDIFLDKSLLNEQYLYIVLDQPEDNMDTKTITTKLIKRLRELKREIQIFVISHSAAVIINGDSENLIYAFEDELALSYSQGRIIDKDMKKNIVDILDGGEKNLRMRFNKYDFKMEDKK